MRKRELANFDANRPAVRMLNPMLDEDADTYERSDDACDDGWSLRVCLLVRRAGEVNMTN